MPPRPECTLAWRSRLLALLHKRQLTLVIGSYAQAWHFNDGPATVKTSVTDAVLQWRARCAQQLATAASDPTQPALVAQQPLV